MESASVIKTEMNIQQCVLEDFPEMGTIEGGPGDRPIESFEEAVMARDINSGEGALPGPPSAGRLTGKLKRRAEPVSGLPEKGRLPAERGRGENGPPVAEQPGRLRKNKMLRLRGGTKGGDEDKPGETRRMRTDPNGGSFRQSGRRERGFAQGKLRRGGIQGEAESPEALPPERFDGGPFMEDLSSGRRRKRME